MSRSVQASVTSRSGFLVHVLQPVAARSRRCGRACKASRRKRPTRALLEWSIFGPEGRLGEVVYSRRWQRRTAPSFRPVKPLPCTSPIANELRRCAAEGGSVCENETSQSMHRLLTRFDIREG